MTPLETSIPLLSQTCCYPTLHLVSCLFSSVGTDPAGITKGIHFSMDRFLDSACCTNANTSARKAAAEVERGNEVVAFQCQSGLVRG